MVPNLLAVDHGLARVRSRDTGDTGKSDIGLAATSQTDMSGGERHRCSIHNRTVHNIHSSLVRPSF